MVARTIVRHRRNVSVFRRSGAPPSSVVRRRKPRISAVASRSQQTTGVRSFLTGDPLHPKLLHGQTSRCWNTGTVLWLIMRVSLLFLRQGSHVAPCLSAQAPRSSRHHPDRCPWPHGRLDASLSAQPVGVLRLVGADGSGLKPRLPSTQSTGDGEGSKYQWKKPSNVETARG